MKKDQSRTKEQLINELLELRQRDAEFRKAESDLILTKGEWEETFDSINDAITIHDKEFTVVRANKAAEKIAGLPFVELSRKKCYQLFHGIDSSPHDCPCYQLFKTGKASTIEKFEPYLNKYIEIKAFPLFNQDAQIIKMVHIVRDITDRKHMEDKLKESEEMYRSMVETTDDSIYIVDKDCKYLFINKKHQSRLGISNDAYIGRTYGEYHSSEETKWFTNKIQKAFETGEAYQWEHLSNRDNNYFLQTLSPIKSGDGTILAVSTISKNVTEFKRMQDKLRMLSVTDDLTGLYNRRGFFSLAEHQLRISTRMRKGIFLLYADIDNLKQVNDKFGHLEGDQLIIITANILKDSFRNSDIIARIGGDEFVIFPVGADEENPDIILNCLQNKIDRANEEITQKYPISLSIGKAYYDPSKPSSIEELLTRADMSMYERKINKNESKSC
jgi:diguanylate cyclase (GGDEF)-like protein/PAS domain S-box-containing protein